MSSLQDSVKQRLRGMMGKTWRLGDNLYRLVSFDIDAADCVTIQTDVRDFKKDMSEVLLFLEQLKPVDDALLPTAPAATTAVVVPPVPTMANMEQRANQILGLHDVEKIAMEELQALTAKPGKEDKPMGKNALNRARAVNDLLRTSLLAAQLKVQTMAMIYKVETGSGNQP